MSGSTEHEAFGKRELKRTGRLLTCARARVRSTKVEGSLMRRPRVSSILSRSLRANSSKARQQKLRKLLRVKFSGVTLKNLRRRSRPMTMVSSENPQMENPLCTSDQEAVPTKRWRRRRSREAFVIFGRGKKRRSYLLRIRLAQPAQSSNRAPDRRTVTDLGAKAKNEISESMELLDWTMQRVQEIQEEIKEPILREQTSNHEEIFDTLFELISSPAPPPRVSRPVTEQTQLSSKTGACADQHRIGARTLETAITEAVKRAVPECRDFVGVIVQRTNPQSRFGHNWILKGVKFGRADREKANEALTAIVDRMQREFRLSD
jgi:hypothetical protein